MVDALGNPLRWILTGGEVADITQAHALIEGLHPQVVVGDKGYDANALVALINAAGAMAVIPPRSIVTNKEPMIDMSIKIAIWWNASSIVSNSFDALPHVMKNSPTTSFLCSTSCVPTSGWLNC